LQAHHRIGKPFGFNIFIEQRKAFKGYDVNRQIVEGQLCGGSQSR